MSERPRKILIVEDSPMMCQMYRMVLEEGEARELLFAADGVEGLDSAVREPDVELFIVDINMPRMDGLEFLRRLRGELGVREVPAIVASTESEEADRAAAREAGANAYLPKPWTPQQLLETIQRLFPDAAG